MRLLVAAVLLLAQVGCVRGPRPALARAAEYLWAQQQPDGGWHSGTYGLLRSGQSMTPFVLDALLQVPDAVYRPPAAKVNRAIAFIRRNTNRDGIVGMMDPGIPDYPNYATALSVSALSRARRPGWERDIAPMVANLRTQQFTEQNGWRREDPVYGAWGMGGDRRTPPGTGHVDLSMTRYVIDALRAFLWNAARISIPNMRPMPMEDFSSRPPNSTPTKQGTMGSIFAVMERRQRMGSWRCWPWAALLTTIEWLRRGNG